MKWVRPLISLAFTGSLIYGFVVGKISTELFVPLAGGAIAWWYRDRQKDKQAESNPSANTTSGGPAT